MLTVLPPLLSLPRVCRETALHHPSPNISPVPVSAGGFIHVWWWWWKWLVVFHTHGRRQPPCSSSTHAPLPLLLLLGSSPPGEGRCVVVCDLGTCTSPNLNKELKLEPNK